MNKSDLIFNLKSILILFLTLSITVTLLKMINQTPAIHLAWAIGWTSCVIYNYYNQKRRLIKMKKSLIDSLKKLSELPLDKHKI